MSNPTTLVQQFAEFPGFPKLTVYNASGTKLKAYTAVVLDTNNLLSDANPLSQGIYVAAPSGTDGSAGVLGVLLEDLDYSTDTAGGQPTSTIVPRGPIVPMKADGAIVAGAQIMVTTDASAGHTPGDAKTLSGGRPALGIALNTAADLEQVWVMVFPGS